MLQREPIEFALLIILISGSCIVEYLIKTGVAFDEYAVLIRLFVYLPFFQLGIYMRDKLKVIEDANSVLYFSFIFFILLAIKCIYGYTPVYGFGSGTACGESVIMYFLVGLLGIAFWMKVAVIVEPAIRGNRYIGSFRRYTFSIMMHQYIGFLCVKLFFYGLSKHISLQFDVNEFKTNLYYYYYLPMNDKVMLIYVIAAIGLSVGLYYVQGVVVSKCKNILERTFARGEN